MMYTIIEDNSPYYIKFNMPNAKEIASICSDTCNRNFNRYFESVALQQSDAIQIINLIPEFKNLKLLSQRLNLFISKPGLYSPPHKDGANMQFGINIPVEIADENCITNWYTDQSLSEYKYYTGPDHLLAKVRQVRQVHGYQVDDVTPAASTIMKPNECLLFNVNHFHDWDNRTSSNRRIVLTLRPSDSGVLTFDDAVKILFK